MKLCGTLYRIAAPFLCAGFLAGAAHAHPLRFPAELNNLQPLSQRFLYALSGPDQLRIGDLLIASPQIHLSIVPAETGKNKFQFRWPAGLLTDGTVAVLGSNGKAVWSGTFSPKEISIQASPKIKEAETVRRNIATLQSPVFENDLVKTMSASAFLTFCVSKVTPETKIYLCSKELLLRTEGSRLVFIPRDSQPKEPFVEMNGKRVSPQGLVYLNDEKADLLMRAQLRSGESLEIMTRRKSVEFLDIVQTQEPGQLRLTTRGAEPVAGPSVKKAGPSLYQVDLPAGRPVYYLMAEGGIPMRQEFLLKGETPTEDLRVHVDKGDTEKTYSSSLTMSGPIPADMAISSHGGDSRVETREGRFVWQLQNLKIGDKNRRTLSIRKDDKNFVGATEVARGRADEVRLNATTTIPSSVASGDILYRRWLENFVWVRSPLTTLRWAVEGSYLMGLNDTPERPKIEGLILGLSMRLSAGFAEELEATGLRFLYGQMKFSGASIASPIVEIFHQRKLKTFLSEALEIQARLWLGGGSDIKLKTSWRVEAAALSPLRPHLHLRWGVSALQWKTEPALPKEAVDLSATLGLVSFF